MGLSMRVVSSHHAAILWAVCWWMLPASGLAGWILSAEQQNCADTCTGAGLTCSEDGARQVDSKHEIDFVLNDMGEDPCDEYGANNVNYALQQPAMFLFTGMPRRCMYTGTGSTCGSSYAFFYRICCCVTNPANWFDECVVPTTTTTTYTSTATTTRTATSVTTTSTTVTQTTSTSSTATQTHTSTFTTTVTMTTSTSSTASETTTYWETSTSTQTTQTTSTATFTTSTATTVTTTSSTATTTSLASTFLTQSATFGDTLLLIDSIVGFSLDDMILLTDGTNYEYVKIIAIDDLAGGGRRLAPFQFTVYPPIEFSYLANTLVQNVGPASLFAGSDPVTYFGGKKYKFWMPVHTELLLLDTPEIRLYGSVFPGPERGQQWFDYFRVVRPDDSPVAQVRIKKDYYSNRTVSSRCATRKFESLDIILGAAKTPLREMKKLEFTAGESVRFEVNCRDQASRTEYLYFETPSIVFVITSSHAGVEFPNDVKLAFKYTHLDFIVLETVRPQSFSGVLPEIWDLKPRSDAVKEMLIPPEEEESSFKVCQEDTNTSSET
eukprot:gb/GFBE01080613.1/.p1 GENE.gb/GFBE01080613.1/~~gb/GFBE01080613.1/.p1  ORF type:complete len:551 (+),score=95.75 gb/GFBE01080613.1/:1-1653(+)